MAGIDLQLHKPDADGCVAVWGHSPYAKRGEAVAETTGADLIRIEDAFLRSLHPGRAGEPPLGLVVCQKAMHFDATQPTDLEDILNDHPLDNAALLNRARDAIARMQRLHLTKYSGFDPATPAPDPGYVLVIDQTRGDASVRQGGASGHDFKEMLYYAQENHPGAHILIKTHPETQQGFRPGYFDNTDLNDRISFIDDAISPWALLEGAVAVYTVSSQMGFEAILAGHKPHVFGKPFYAGWGLTQDFHQIPRRKRSLTKAQLFAGAMMLYPIWYDPYRDQLCALETVLDTLEAKTHAWRDDYKGWDGIGIRLWKRRQFNLFFGGTRPMRFRKTPHQNALRPTMGWARTVEAYSSDREITRVEDGFLRSNGLGASLVPPLSLVLDADGIYYDPTRPSQLEAMISQNASLPGDAQRRAETLRRRLVRNKLSKYNLKGESPALPEGHLILVPGQVEDDASIRLGTTDVSTNLGLLQRARAENPTAIILYKPHPDVEAGLRPGAIASQTALEYADVVLEQTDAMAVLDHVAEVWTMTSLLGFEALLRGKSVTTLGAPFYAGWGLTRDLGEIPDRRKARVDLDGLVHATLIDYPRYLDPVTRQPCAVEVVADRLAEGWQDKRPALRILSKLQGIFASVAHLWR